MHDTGLKLEGFSVAFGDRVVLWDVSCGFPARGMSLLVGPVASGKSTLLRTLAGLNHAQPELRLRGRAEWNGGPLFHPSGGSVRQVRVCLVLQKARFFVDSVRENLVSALPNRSALNPRQQSELIVELLAEHGLGHLRDELAREVVELPHSVQRHLAVLRAIASEPELLLADEPTAGVDSAAAGPILESLASQVSKRSVVLVTHHQQQARRAGGTTHLLVEGRIEETAPTARFFDSPHSVCGQRFVRTGGCCASGVSRPKPQTAEHPPRDSFAWCWPRGFFWLIPGEVGGMPRPGLLGELDQDLRGLQRIGVRVLIGLEETASIPASELERYALNYVHFPIVDMGVPDRQHTAGLFERVESLVAHQHPVAFHCRAGLGRTGTLLACLMVWRGRSVADAIDAVRGFNPMCIQSHAQAEFIQEFALLARTVRSDSVARCAR